MKLRKPKNTEKEKVKIDEDIKIAESTKSISAAPKRTVIKSLSKEQKQRIAKSFNQKLF